MTTAIAPTTNAGVEAELAFDTAPGMYQPKAPTPAATKSRKGAMA
jgi:hypothetical protein